MTVCSRYPVEGRRYAARSSATANSAVTPAPGAATILARRVSVKLPLPILADTGFGTTPRLVAVPAACFTEAESACTAKTAPGTPIASTEKPADQTDKTARRCRQDPPREPVSALRRPTSVARKWSLPFMLAAYPSWDHY